MRVNVLLSTVIFRDEFSHSHTHAHAHRNTRKQKFAQTCTNFQFKCFMFVLRWLLHRCICLAKLIKTVHLKYVYLLHLNYTSENLTQKVKSKPKKFQFYIPFVFVCQSSASGVFITKDFSPSTQKEQSDYQKLPVLGLTFSQEINF